jgi:hypothetical protein
VDDFIQASNLAFCKMASKSAADVGAPAAARSQVGTGIAQRVSLNAKSSMPMFGLGTSHNGGRAVGAAVTEAVRLGVRLFDTAQHYGTEAAVGNALAK